MKYLIALMIPILFVMCKSKEVLPTAESVVYYVVFKEGITPKKIKDDLKFDLSQFEKASDSSNQWLLDFQEEASKASKIRSSLLNHADVVSVFSKEQYVKIKAKKESGGKAGKLGRKVEKQ